LKIKELQDLLLVTLFYCAPCMANNLTV